MIGLQYGTDLSGTPFLVGGLVCLGLYAYFAVCLMVMARKTGTGPEWLAWIPLANLLLMCRIGGKSGAWVVLLLVPLVNVLFAVLLFVAMARERGKPAAAGVLVLVPVVNLILPFYLASGPATISARPMPAPVAGGGAATCAGCGARLDPGDRFCGACGAPIERATPSARAAAPSPPPAAARAEASSSWAGTIVAVVVFAVIVAGGVYAYRVFFGDTSSDGEDEPWVPSLPENVPTTEKGEFTNLSDPDTTTVPADELPEMLTEEILRELGIDPDDVHIIEDETDVGDGDG